MRTLLNVFILIAIAFSIGATKHANVKADSKKKLPKIHFVNKELKRKFTAGVSATLQSAPYDIDSMTVQGFKICDKIYHGSWGGGSSPYTGNSLFLVIFISNFPSGTLHALVVQDSNGQQTPILVNKNDSYGLNIAIDDFDDVVITCE